MLSVTTVKILYPNIVFVLLEILCTNITATIVSITTVTKNLTIENNFFTILTFIPNSEYMLPVRHFQQDYNRHLTISLFLLIFLKYFCLIFYYICFSF